MVALKASWQVRAGLIPGTAMTEYDKSWLYTSDHYTADGRQRGEIYERAGTEAHEYAAQLETGGLNWVTLEYLWL